MVSCRYVTAFTYLHLLDQGSLTMQDVKAHVKLQPCCGTLSYSKIPTYYTYCLGMTGTLECLTKVCVTVPVKFSNALNLFSSFYTRVLKSTLLPSGAKRIAFTIRLSSAHLPALHLCKKDAQCPPRRATREHARGDWIIRRVLQCNLG